MVPTRSQFSEILMPRPSVSVINSAFLAIEVFKSDPYRGVEDPLQGASQSLMSYPKGRFAESEVNSPILSLGFDFGLRTNDFGLRSVNLGRGLGGGFALNELDRK